MDKMGQIKQLQKLTMQTQLDSQERRQTITPTASQGNAALSAQNAKSVTGVSQGNLAS